MSNFLNEYLSPLGILKLESDGEYLTGLWFDKSKDNNKHTTNNEYKDLPIFDETKKWLDIYFSGKNPSFTPKYKVTKATEFQKSVYEIMLKIPYGKTITYNEIAKEIADKRGIKRMSAQAVGHAVGANQICIIIPCHRVIGVNNNLTGYGGGILNKIKLLELEGIDTSSFVMPRK